MNIFRVPVDIQHFNDTIVKGKDYDEIAPYLVSGEDEVIPIENGKIRYWGSLPGKSNLKTFDLLSSGDEILFYRSGKYVAYATIAYHDSEKGSLAEYSWGTNKNGDTWELVYFLKNVKLLSLPTGIINKEFGLKPGHVMGFSKLSDERVRTFLQKYGSVANFVSQHRYGKPL